MTTLIDQVEEIFPTMLTGSVVRTEGLMAAIAGFPAPVGAMVEIERQSGPPVPAEVIGFRESATLVYPYADMSGVRHGNRVRLVRTSKYVRCGTNLLGRVVDANGIVVDGREAPSLTDRVPLMRRPPPACDRPRIEQPLTTGVRTLDGLLTIGVGQRMGIFAGSGVGKSVTIGMMARGTSADVNVIGLIGERGREVNEFLERDLGPEGMARSVVVVATSDEPALMRIQAANTATAVAEYFRDQGKNVLLIMDSVTRFAMAQREVGLAAGEPPTTKGYPPSVFALLPRLVERAGRGKVGSITAFYSVLVEGDDTNDPVADTVRGLIDGHTVLSRKIAGRGHYPAVDILQSISRLMNDIVSKDHRESAQLVRELIAVYRDHEDLISIGAYRQGANPMVDTAIAMRDEISKYMRQAVTDQTNAAQAKAELLALAQKCQTARASYSNPGAKRA